MWELNYTTDDLGIVYRTIVDAEMVKGRLSFQFSLSCYYEEHDFDLRRPLLLDQPL